MQIFVDDIPDLASADPGSRLGPLLAQIRQWLNGEGLAVREWVLDGEALTSARQAELSDRPVDAFGRLDVRTSDRFELSLDLISGAQRALAALAKKHVRTAGLFQEGREAEALLALRECIDDWNGLMERTGASSAICGVPLSETARSRLRELAGVLAQVDGAFRQGDALRLADLVEHDLRPRLADWETLLDGQIEAVRALQPPRMN